MRPRFLNKDEFAQVVRNTPLVSYSATKAPITEIKLVRLVYGRPAKPVSPWI
jgi:hypothetical protein